MFAGAKGVAKLAEINELRHLRFAHDKLRAVFDFLLQVRIAKGKSIAGIILPLDDFEELCFEVIHQAHAIFGLSFSAVFPKNRPVGTTNCAIFCNRMG